MKIPVQYNIVNKSGLIFLLCTGCLGLHFFITSLESISYVNFIFPDSEQFSKLSSKNNVAVILSNIDYSVDRLINKFPPLHLEYYLSLHELAY